ncbi:MAG: hypothetical protein F4Y24_00460 [Gemmatimonadetes bacterium]|nr:hypothetical protein [Gemmatimonadota bacterium]MYG23678.1 hypothetical protein [Gemmatimonadota bacterium]MYJ39495.1 hypothetical protein [Gemmatimonadota bacterium]
MVEILIRSHVPEWAEEIDFVLTLRGYPEAMKLGGAKTMTEMVDRFRQGLDELVQRGAREGRQEGQAMVLRRQVTRRFGEATAGELSDLLDELTRPEDIDKVTDALIECTTGADFIERVRIG